MSKINVIWAKMSVLWQNSSFVQFSEQLHDYMKREHHYARCSRQTILGRMLLKSLFPGKDWCWLLAEIDYSSSGKPFLRNASLQFNISHADDIVALAYSEQTELGADVVRIDQPQEHARLFLHEREVNKKGSIGSLNSIWAKKEAMGKLIGEGWGIGFSGINTMEPVYYEGKRVFFSEAQLTDRYYCTVSTMNNWFPVNTNELTVNKIITWK